MILAALVALAFLQPRRSASDSWFNQDEEEQEEEEEQKSSGNKRMASAQLDVGGSVNLNPPAYTSVKLNQVRLW